MISNIISSIAIKLLEWAFAYIQKYIENAEAQSKREALDAENQKKLDEAKGRADRIRHACDLLNGTSDGPC